MNLIIKPRWNRRLKCSPLALSTIPQKSIASLSLSAEKSHYQQTDSISVSLSLFLYLSFSHKKREICRVNQDLKDVKIGWMSARQIYVCLFIFILNQRLVNLSRWIQPQRKPWWWWWEKKRETRLLFGIWNPTAMFSNSLIIFFLIIITTTIRWSVVFFTYHRQPTAS